MTKFKRGDVVKLKSGGPDLTVVQEDVGTIKTKLAWMDESGTYREAFIPDECLEEYKVKDNEPVVKFVRPVLTLSDCKPSNDLKRILDKHRNYTNDTFPLDLNGCLVSHISEDSLYTINIASVEFPKEFRRWV